MTKVWWHVRVPIVKYTNGTEKMAYAFGFATIDGVVVDTPEKDLKGKDLSFVREWAIVRRATISKVTEYAVLG